MSNYLITGAGGFLGTHLVEALLNKNLSDILYCTDIAKNQLIERYNAYSWYKLNETRIKFVSTEELLNEDFAMNEINCVIFCAFPRNVKGPEFANGLLYVKQMIKRVSLSKNTAFINISSQSLYDSNRKEPAKETDPLYLDTPYCVGKFMSEELCDTYFSNQNKYTNIRMASLIGPGFDQRVVNKMVASAMKNNSISIIENNQKFGFVDIEDAVEGILSVLDSFEEKNWDVVYNLGSDKTYTLKEIAIKIKGVLESNYGFKNIDIIQNGKNDLYLNSSLDASRLSSLTQFKCNINLETSVKKIVEYYS